MLYFIPNLIIISSIFVSFGITLLWLPFDLHCILAVNEMKLHLLYTLLIAKRADHTTHDRFCREQSMVVNDQRS